MDTEAGGDCVTAKPCSDTDRIDSLDDLESLFRQDRSRMVRLAHLLTGSPALAEEVVHDSFITVFEKRAVINDPAAYLRRVVVNGCHTQTRRQALERSKLELVARQTQHASVEPAPDVGDLWASLDLVTSKQRCALVLRFYEDLSNDATAEAMGVRPGTVKSLVHRGLETLRKEVSND